LRHLHLDDLIKRLEQHIELKLVEEINIDNTDVIASIINNLNDQDITLSRIASAVERQQGTQPIDPVWLKRVTQLVARLKQLKWKYTHGTSGNGRSSMGIINATGCSSVWGSTYPYNPYPFPWANHLFQDTASMALGVFEGHMAKMAEGFKAIRLAELELNGKYNSAEHDTFFNYFNWHQFSDEEFQLCPPVVAVGGDGAMYDIGFQNLSRAMMTAKPIKVVVLDTQVYSNTGGQACTSGFTGQISDMAPFGKVSAGKQEIRKEIGLIAMAHRTTYVMQSTIAYPNHMIEGFIEGLMSKRPAVFNCYTSCQPEHGIGDDMGHHQAKLAVESRAYPLFRYNPDKGVTPSECFDLDGNPAIHKPWHIYKLRYKENKREKVMELPQTFADFAMTEIRFRKHFRIAPHDTWHENMIPLHEFLELDQDEQEEKFPFIWTVNSKQQLSRLLVDQSIVDSCKDRQNFWLMLKELAQIELPATTSPDLEDKIRQDVISHIAADLAQLAGSKGEPASAPSTPAATASQATPQPSGNYMAPWLDTEDCTACDECTNINPEMFAYNENGKAYIQNPNAGTYQELVRAAERCTAKVIHPGLPVNPDAKDMSKWIKRGEKFN
jgi:pyruvate-ferredoxin/flavodoxin oxidoreductase